MEPTPPPHSQERVPERKASELGELLVERLAWSGTEGQGGEPKKRSKTAWNGTK